MTLAGKLWDEDLGKLILRITLGFLMLFHGGETIMRTNTILATTDPVPDVIIWPLALMGEIIAPLLIMLGVFTRIGAFFIAGFMVCALLLRHTFGESNHWLRTVRPMVEGAGAYGLESQLFFLSCALAVMLLGAGKYSLNIGGKWN
jgi:putative oxidoreductase